MYWGRSWEGRLAPGHSTGSLLGGLQKPLVLAHPAELVAVAAGVDSGSFHQYFGLGASSGEEEARSRSRASCFEGPVEDNYTGVTGLPWPGKEVGRGNRNYWAAHCCHRAGTLSKARMPDVEKLKNVTVAVTAMA